MYLGRNNLKYSTRVKLSHQKLKNTPVDTFTYLCKVLNEELQTNQAQVNSGIIIHYTTVINNQVHCTRRNYRFCWIHATAWFSDAKTFLQTSISFGPRCFGISVEEND